MNSNPVPGKSVHLDERPGDIVQPMDQPFSDGPPFAGLRELARLAAPLQLVDTSDHCRPALAHRVSAVRPSIVAHTNCHPPMPEAVPPQVDGRAAVGLADHYAARSRFALRRDATNVSRASAGMRRSRPISTDSTSPLLTNAHMRLRPIANRSAA